VRRHNAELPLALDRVLRRALAKDPEARYATATDLANALRDAASDDQRTRTLRVVRETARDVRRAVLSRPVRVAAGVMCLLALVAATWSTFRRVTDFPRTVGSASSVTREMEPTARPSTPTAIPTESRPASPTATPPVQRKALPTSTVPAPRPAAPKVAPPTATASATVAQAAIAPPAASPVAAVSQEARCLSVNALPFAEVYVDDRSVGYTPAACLRVPMGEHRIRFEMDGQRSPERLLRITARHTPNAPMRISYDFNTGRFIEQ
jgi:PEGA domain